MYQYAIPGISWNHLSELCRSQKLQVLPTLLLGGWAALGKDCGELRKRHVTSLGSALPVSKSAMVLPFMI